MAISVVKTTGSNTNQTTSWDITLPTGSGGYIVAFIGRGRNTIILPPSGSAWTVLKRYPADPAGSGEVSSAVFVWDASSSDPSGSNLTFTSSATGQTYWHVFRVTGISSNPTLLDCLSLVQTSTTEAGQVPPSISEMPGGSRSAAVFIFNSTDNGGAVIDGTNDSNFTSNLSIVGTGGTSAAYTASSYYISTISSLTIGSWSYSSYNSSEGINYTLVLYEDESPGIQYIKDASIGDGSTSSTNITGIQSGDFILYHGFSDGSTNNSVPTIAGTTATAISAWAGANGTNRGIYYGFSTGTSCTVANLSTSGTGIGHYINVFRNVDSSSPIHTSANGTNSGSTYWPLPPNVTTTINNCAIISIATIDDDIVDFGGYAMPKSTLIGLAQSSGAAGSTAAAIHCIATQVSAGTHTGETIYYNSGPDSNAAYTIALTAVVPETGSGTPSITLPTASGSASVTVAQTASGTPSLSAVPTASGSAIIVFTSSGTPSLPAVPTATGAAIHSENANGTPSITIPTTSGAATNSEEASGTPSIAAVISSGASESYEEASGGPSITKPTATGAATNSEEASGAPSITLLTATGVAKNLVQEQEGYRFRNDDGSESAATWKTTQDTNISASAQEDFRLRIVVNNTGDYPAKTYKLQYKKTTDSEWTDID